MNGVEQEAKLLLLGWDALPVREQWLLAWLVDVGADVGMDFLEYTEDAGIDFLDMVSRWRAMGLLRSGYDLERDCGLYLPTDRAIDLVTLSPVEWITATALVKPVDLDAVVAA